MGGLGLGGLGLIDALKLGWIAGLSFSASVALQRTRPLVTPTTSHPPVCSKKRREGSVRVKSRAGGQQGVEARLETKAHRRVSRRSVKQKLSELVRDVEDDQRF